MKENLKQKIIERLTNVPQCRDSDQYLTLSIWSKYHSEKMFKNQAGEICVRLRDIMELPREDNVKRIRAKLNEEGLYLSENLEVLRKRKQLENEWRERLGYKRREI